MSHITLRGSLSDSSEEEGDLNTMVHNLCLPAFPGAVSTSTPKGVATPNLSARNQPAGPPAGQQMEQTQGSGNAAAQLTVNMTAQGVDSAAAQTGLNPQAFMMKAFLEMQQTLIKLQVTDTSPWNCT